MDFREIVKDKADQVNTIKHEITNLEEVDTRVLKRNQLRLNYFKKKFKKELDRLIAAIAKKDPFNLPKYEKDEERILGDIQDLLDIIEDALKDPKREKKTNGKKKQKSFLTIYKCVDCKADIPKQLKEDFSKGNLIVCDQCGMVYDALDFGYEEDKLTIKKCQICIKPFSSGDSKKFEKGQAVKCRNQNCLTIYNPKNFGFHN